MKCYLTTSLVLNNWPQTVLNTIMSCHSTIKFWCIFNPLSTEKADNKIYVFKVKKIYFVLAISYGEFED